jgi:hypothetical protein
VDNTAFILHTSSHRVGQKLPAVKLRQGHRRHNRHNQARISGVSLITRLY